MCWYSIYLMQWWQWWQWCQTSQTCIQGGRNIQPVMASWPEGTNVVSSVIPDPSFIHCQNHSSLHFAHGFLWLSEQPTTTSVLKTRNSHCCLATLNGNNNGGLVASAVRDEQLQLYADHLPRAQERNACSDNFHPLSMKDYSLVRVC